MSKSKKNQREMLINTVQGQEVRIAIVSDEGLEELYVERTATASHVGSIYKGRVTNVESAIQAAFVDIGLGKHGFLHVSDVNPTYFPKSKKSGPEAVGRKRPHYVRPPIQECLRRGQEVVVQMTKEGIGTKGPTMTTYLSIPGRLLVMMPGMTKHGVSRKVEDDAARSRARDILADLKPPGDIGFIVRTAGVDRSKRDLQRDLNYLLRLWKSVKQRIKKAKAPVELYRESDLVTRTIRDIYNTEIGRIVCDRPAVAHQVKEFLSVAMPRTKHVIELYTGKEGLFYEAGLEEEIEKIHARRVELPSGGSLVIDQTEALVAIDVNSGRYRQHSNAETTAAKTDIEAAKEIVRQLRLRDLGGVIVIDFIDVREDRNRRAIERELRDALKNDRAKTKVLKMSAFGLVELTRQRLGPSLRQSFFDRCPLCDGQGVSKSAQSLSLLMMRNIERATACDDVDTVEAVVPPTVAHQLGNYQRKQITELEGETGKTVLIRADDEAGDGHIRCTNARGAEVAWDHSAPGREKKQPKQFRTIPIEQVPAPAQRSAETPPPPMDDDEDQPDDQQKQDDQKQTDQKQESSDQPKKKRSRRGRRGGRKHRKKRAAQDQQNQNEPSDDQQKQDDGRKKDKDQAPPADRQTQKDDGKEAEQAGNGQKDDRKDQAGDAKKKDEGKEKGEDQDEKPKPKRRRRRKKADQPKDKDDGGKDKDGKDGKDGKGGKGKDQGEAQQSDDQDGKGDTPEGGDKKDETTDDSGQKSGQKKRRRRRKKTPSGDQGGDDQGGGDQPAESSGGDESSN